MTKKMWEEGEGLRFDGGGSMGEMMKMSRNIYTNYKSPYDKLHQKWARERESEQKVGNSYLSAASKLSGNKNITEKQ